MCLKPLSVCTQTPNSELSETREPVRRIGELRVKEVGFLPKYCSTLNRSHNLLYRTNSSSEVLTVDCHENLFSKGKES